MSITLPAGLPAASVLRREGLFVSEAPGGQGPSLPHLRIALLNLMPTKAATETQIARLIGSAPFHVDLTLFTPPSYAPKTTPIAHLETYYTPWSEIAPRRFDGLIITGAPVETLPFEEVYYWRELTGIFDWAQRNVGRSLHICWAAQAALRHAYGVPKHQVPAKIFGVFPHQVLHPKASLLSGFSDEFHVPVSRHTEVRRADLPTDRGLELLADSREAGLCLIEDRVRRATYMFNHLEYDTDTLAGEYRRDQEAGRPITVPKYYFPQDNPAHPPVNRWRSYAHILFWNWLSEVHRSAGQAPSPLRRRNDRGVQSSTARRPAGFTPSATSAGLGTA
ncbi:MAG: homoserine O-succinyltransferase [Alphaproteobacteria bacterium]|nr:homoserine O-succinyltransferase [Alphaproteobacteria bacterium]